MFLSFISVKLLFLFTSFINVSTPHSPINKYTVSNSKILNKHQQNSLDNKIKRLYVDDEKSNLIAFKANFRKDFDVLIAESATEGLAILKKELINIIVTDQRMPDTTGVEFLESIMDEFPAPIRILLTGYTDLQTVVEAVNKGKIYQYVTKPYNEAEFKQILLTAFDEYEKDQKLIRDNQQYEFILRQKLLR